MEDLIQVRHHLAEMDELTGVYEIAGNVTDNGEISITDINIYSLDYIKNKEGAQEVRPIYVNGEEVLSANVASGPLNLVAGRNIAMKAEGNNVIIAATSSGGGGSCDCPELIEGEGIDIIDDEVRGQKIISLEPGSISDDYIESVSWSKLVQDESTTIILNGGKAK